MSRRFKNKKSIEIEKIVKESTMRIGIRELSDERIALLTRLIFSGIANYFFTEPDNLVNMGFLQFKKNPDKDELFSVNILRSGKDGVVNADTLWRYYKGELAKEAELKQVIDSFVGELLSYSQQQEKNIDKLTRKLN